mmetsp:Transcript_14506/g.39437  ORF Transcript_14506/g.39437 Transcript_14506/m.39437 type:complete len:277 (+) Transcript_14506:33-863(+)
MCAHQGSASETPRVEARSDVADERMSTEHHPNFVLNEARCACCGPFGAFLVVAVILLPLLIFLVSSIFAVPLWAIECEDDPALCSYYEWFKYICGNLVGLGNPLTNYAPDSGHWLAELLDLLIAAWSMGFAGLVYGLVGAMGFVAVTTQLLDEGVSTRVQKVVPMRKKIHTLAADASGLDVDEFLSVAKDMDPKTYDEDKLRALFKEVDHDNEGVIRLDRVGELIRKFEQASKAAKTSQDTIHVQELAQLVMKLNNEVRELNARIDSSIPSISISQ